MQIIADLHIHSRFSRAVSPEMTIPNIAAWAKKKGIDLIATGDWTHPMWFREIEKDLEEMGTGLLRLKSHIKTTAEVMSKNFDSSSIPIGDSKPSQSLRGSGAEQNFSHSPLSGAYFLLATEVSSIYTQNGKGRRVHTVVMVPSVDSARKIGQEMTRRGCNLMSDVRPIIPLSCIQLAELVFSIEPKALVIPAHIWTPWFSAFGAMSGFGSLKEAFGDYAEQIYAIETGLSSNPSMNWQIKELDHRSILSSSDAHSGPKIGREATVFEIPEGKLSYDAIYEAIKGNFSHSPRLRSSILYTIEFYPEEGKYHFSGHRACNIRYGPGESTKNGTTCPVCGKPLTQGVVQRVEQLARRTETDLKLTVKKESLVKDGPEVAIIKSELLSNRPGFVMLVPLQEIIAECIGSPIASKKTVKVYDELINKFNGEFNVLLHTKNVDIAEIAGEKIAEGIHKVRTGNIIIDPGYDGVFGIVKIWKEGETPLVDKTKEQLGLF